jgi:hypothetical protein
MNKYDQLVQKMEAFQPYLEDSFLYTYIAPKDKEQFFSFLASIYNSSASHSLYLRLSDPNVVKKILQDLHMLEDTELEIYVATNDQYAVQWMNKPLHEYIHEHNINFSV